jgi:hypothetical protein
MKTLPVKLLFIVLFLGGINCSLLWAGEEEGGVVYLPPSPSRLISPQSGEIINGPISAREFVWSIVAQAVKYHLEVSPDRKFYRIIREAYPDDNRYIFENMPEGTYFWRVSSIDERGMEGGVSPIQYFVYPRH